MRATICLITAATVWHDEPIKIHVHPPIGALVREYVALRGRHPCGAQVQILGGEVVSQSPPVSLTPKGSSHNSHLTIRDLSDAQLREVLEELQLEKARKEGQHPYMGHPWVSGGPLWELMLTWMIGNWPSKGEGMRT